MLKAALIACISLSSPNAAAPLSDETVQLTERAVDKDKINTYFDKPETVSVATGEWGFLPSEHDHYPKYMGTRALDGCTGLVIYNDKGCFLAHVQPDEPGAPTYEWKQALEAGMCDEKAQVAFDGGRAIIVGSKSGGYEFEWQINQIKEWLDGYNIRWSEEPYLIDYGHLDEEIALAMNVPPEYVFSKCS